MIIEITGVTNGAGPYDIYLCDPTNTSCFYISGNTSIHGSVYVNTESFFPNENLLYIKIVDTSGCIKYYLINCSEQKLFQDLFFFDFMDGNHYIFQ